jgi:hypothetical protein
VKLNELENQNAIDYITGVCGDGNGISYAISPFVNIVILSIQLVFGRGSSIFFFCFYIIMVLGKHQHFSIKSSHLAFDNLIFITPAQFNINK